MSDLLPAENLQRNAENNDSASLFALLSDDLLDKCFSFVGKGFFRYVGGTCQRFRDVYVNERERTTDTFWRTVSERVPCAELCLKDYAWLGRTTREKKQLIEQIGVKSIESGKVEVLKWAINNGFLPCNYHFDSVGESGHVNVLEWAHENRIDWHSDALMYDATRHGNISVWDFAYGKKPSAFDDWVVYVCLRLAAKFGHIHVLEWLKQKDLLPEGDGGRKIMSSAAQNGQVHVLDWLCDNGYQPSNSEVVDAAARTGHVNVLQWARDRGIHGSEQSCAGAARFGHLNALQWLRENGCPWNGEVIFQATVRRHDHIVVWASENGCPDPFGDADPFAGEDIEV